MTAEQQIEHWERVREVQIGQLEFAKRCVERANTKKSRSVSMDQWGAVLDDLNATAAKLAELGIEVPDITEEEDLFLSAL